jgi:hypothetical protein
MKQTASLLDEVPLRKLYELTVQQFPGVVHSPAQFLAGVEAVYRRDPLRLSGRLELHQQQGLDYMLKRTFPYNEILTAIEKYLQDRDVSDRENYAWQQRLINQEFIFKS